MGQVTVTALRAVSLPESQNGIAAQQQRAAKQAVASAVHVLNESGIAGSGREVTYSTDSATKKLIIQIVDKQSGDVIVQWPSEYGLQVAQEYQKDYPVK
jgi:uncharacterized FlaG/YvyC family protein